MVNIERKYLNYLKKLVCDDIHPINEYSKLFKTLRKFRFDSIIELDDNRIADAISMRASFEHENGYFEPQINDPISVLEVMVALAVRCEETIMGNEEYGDRTSVWFWYMVKSLGLEAERDDDFDELYCIEVLTKLVERDYSRDGQGSLFYIEGCIHDLRTVEIWYQMNWWLDTIGD